MEIDFLPAEKVTELGITEDQIKAITPLYVDHVAKIKNDFSSEANKNAENIIMGAIEASAKKFGVEAKRNEGEKSAEYLERIADLGLGKEKANILALKSDYEKKLKEFNGGDATVKELSETKEKLDKALEKYADYEDLKAKAEKYEPLETEYKSLKQKVFFQNEKPNFPDTVNPYEAKAKWDAFVQEFNEKWEASIDENGNSIAINKENNHLKKKLSELVAADANISALMQGRKQDGMNHRQNNNAGSIKIEGYEFPESAKTDHKERAKVIKEALVEKGLNPATQQYSDEFAKLNKAIVEHK